MEPDELPELDLFEAIRRSGARALLIGRRALILLGLPVATFDYDFWIHFDDVEKLNDALAPFGHFPNATPAEARARGRYVIENGEHIDVMLAREKTTPHGVAVSFDAVWARRTKIAVGRTSADVPTVEDLILTKEWGARAKDIADIQLLRALANRGRQ